MTAFWISLAIAGSIVIAFPVYILWATGGDVTGWIHKMDESMAGIERAWQELQACHGEGQPCPVSRRRGCEQCADKLAAYRLVKRDAFGAMPRGMLVLGAGALAVRWLCYPLSPVRRRRPPKDDPS